MFFNYLLFTLAKPDVLETKLTIAGKKMRCYFIQPAVLLPLLLFSLHLLAGADTKPKQNEVNVKKADTYFTNRQFREALNAYYSAYTSNPSNPDLGFKVGLCYHYLLQKPAYSLQLFTIAAKRTQPKYNFYGSRNFKTSFDARYFLGKTYLAQNKTDSAMLHLADYASAFDNNMPVDASRQLKMCANYNLLKKQVRNVTPERLPLPVNTLYSESHPVLSIDHKELFYASRKPAEGAENQPLSDNNIYFCTLQSDNTWSDPTPFPHNTAFDEEPLYLTTDGKKLYFRKTDKKGNGDIFFSIREEQNWSTPQKHKAANSAFDEAGIAFTPDGTIMVVSSNRPDGIGGYDLYLAAVKNGKPGKLKNMGAAINTELDEITPYFHPVDKRIYFSTNGNTKYGMGGFDVFFTQADSTTAWSDAFTMGYPINKGGNEINYYVVSEGVAYYTAVSDNGDFDIYEVKRGIKNENIESEIVAEYKVVEPDDNTIIELLEVEKEKIVEKEKEVEVAKVEEVEVEVEKNIGMVDAEQAKTLDNVIAIEQKEVEVQVPVEVEVVNPTGTRPVVKDDGTVIKTDGTIDEKLTAQNKGTTTPTAQQPTPPATEKQQEEPTSLHNTYNTPRQQDEQPASSSNTGAVSKNNNLSTIPATVSTPSNNSAETTTAEDLLKNLTKAERDALIQKIKADLLKEINEKRTAVFKTLYFDFNSNEVKLESYELKILVDFLKENKNVNIEVVGHTDNIGSWETNFWISRQRAKSVYDYLVQQGIATNRIIFNGKGGIQPVASNSTPIGRAQNRRVEVVLIQ